MRTYITIYSLLLLALVFLSQANADSILEVSIHILPSNSPTILLFPLLSPYLHLHQHQTNL
jgi:hypothetical protein